MVKRVDVFFFLVFIVLTIAGCMEEQQLGPSKIVDLPHVTSPREHFIQQVARCARRLNATILQTRQTLLKRYKQYRQRKSFNVVDQAWLQRLAKQYHITVWDASNIQSWQLLLTRVDIVPNALVIAQAINESAWGTSRFAREANNYFGQWCYQRGCGLIPKRRPAGKHYEVKRFDNLQASMRAYLHNLNTAVFYKDFRQLRAKLRRRGDALNALMLVKTLSNYSQQRQQYVNSLHALMTHYHLSKFDD